MILFWSLCAAMLLVAILFIVLPLLRKTVFNTDIQRDTANLGILQDQSAELDTDLKNGLLTQEAYDQGKRELQVRLSEEVKTFGGSDGSTRNPTRVLAIVLAVLLPILCIPIYMYLGNSDALTPQAAIVADEDGVIHSDESLQLLERKIKRQSKDPNDWWMLARSYTERQRYDDAVSAYQRLVELVPNEAQLWANYADVYAMAHGKTLQNDKVTEYLNKALELNGNNPTALALSGSAAMERQDYVTAITRWRALINQLEPSSPEIEVYQGGIKQAVAALAAQPGGKQKLAELMTKNDKVTGTSAGAVTGKVSLSKSLAGKASPSDTVFILARAAQGPRMPLAVLRKQVKDLPMKFALDDSMAMQPQLKLSGFDQVIVVARISKSGSPMPQTGDLEGTTGTIKPGTQGLNIVIDKVVP